MINYNKILDLIENKDVVGLSTLIIDNNLSLNDIEWNIKNKISIDTIELKNFLLIVADNIIGLFYETHKGN